MRNTTNLLIINLAIADLLFIVFCVPFTATDYVIPFWPFGLAWCKIVQYLIVVCAYTSVYTLVLMSVDRFLAVVYPVEAMAIRTERNTCLAIVAVWMVSVLCCIPWAYAHGFEEYTYNKEEYNVCRFRDTDNQMIYQIVFFYPHTPFL
uniref:G-protein coupled receptors family 1 profile domain-containing protein n=1 Tax=Strigamia maritima TaxID=126957 RepID=T1IYC9_STRMM